jgi:hypothetical protein
MEELISNRYFTLGLDRKMRNIPSVPDPETDAEPCTRTLDYGSELRSGSGTCSFLINFQEPNKK